MSKIFYDHLTLHEEITAKLDIQHLDPQEREELVDLIDQTLHHHVLDLILTHLPREHHADFVSRLHAAPHDLSLLDYLKTHIPDIEAKISSHAAKVKKEILSDIKKSQTHRGK